MQQGFHRSPFAWGATVVAGVAVPAVAMLLLLDAPLSLARQSAPILAGGMMGIGMIGAAAARRLWVGVVLGLAVGLGLILLVRGLGLAAMPHPVSLLLAVVLASLSFAARGALFARAYPAWGWLIAVAVVAGEAATLLTAALLPAWLLALLPAQWASMALATAINGTGTRAAGSALFALGFTAASTLLVARLLPRRWPYLLMFTAWIGCSALVMHWPVPPPLSQTPPRSTG